MDTLHLVLVSIVLALCFYIYKLKSKYNQYDDISTVEEYEVDEEEYNEDTDEDTDDEYEEDTEEDTDEDTEEDTDEDDDNDHFHMERHDLDLYTIDEEMQEIAFSDNGGEGSSKDILDN